MDAAEWQRSLVVAPPRLFPLLEFHFGEQRELLFAQALSLSMRPLDKINRWYQDAHLVCVRAHIGKMKVISQRLLEAVAGNTNIFNR